MAGEAAASRGKKKPKSLDDLVKEFPALAEVIETQRAQAIVQQDLEARIGVLEIAAPAAVRAMSLEEIEAAIAKDFNVEFEVLARWTFLGETFVPGRLLRRSHYTHLIDFVRDGLRLGMPINGGELNARATEARIRADARAAVRDGTH